MTPKDVSKEVRDTMECLKKRGIKLALGSSSKNAKFILKKFVKPKVVGEKSYSQNSPTAPQFLIKERQDFDLEKWHLKDEDLTALNDPENENYWEIWEHVLNTAYFEIDGKKYSLYQEGDLLAIAYDHLTDEEKDNLGFDNF